MSLSRKTEFPPAENRKSTVVMYRLCRQSMNPFTECSRSQLTADCYQANMWWRPRRIHEASRSLPPKTMW